MTHMVHVRQCISINMNNNYSLTSTVTKVMERTVVSL